MNDLPLGNGPSSPPCVSLIIPMRDPRPDLLRRALTSAVSQTFRDIEIIVVDDGSSRPIAGLIDDLALNDSRVCVIHQENQGVSAARNRGLIRARGRFLAFLDSDDFVSEDFVYSAVSAINDTSADIVFGKILVRSLSGNVTWGAQDAEAGAISILSAAQLEAVRARTLAASPSFNRDFPAVAFTNVVSAVYRAEAVRDLLFPPGVIHGEDRIFNFIALGRANRVATVNHVWYHYDRTHESGVTTGFSAQRLPELRETVRAFARVGGLTSGDEPARISSELKASSALGILNYVKLAALSCAKSRGLSGSGALAEVLELTAVQDAIPHLSKLHVGDRVVATLVEHRRAKSLVLISKIRMVIMRLPDRWGWSR